MYIHMSRTSRVKNRKKTKRLRASLKAKNRRRMNRVSGRRISAR